MAKFASGKFAKRISDRSGMAFPYNEMVKEWNGSICTLLLSLKQKHPQLEPLPISQLILKSLENAKPQTAISRVFVGGANGPIEGGRIVVKPDGSDAAYDWKRFWTNC